MSINSEFEPVIGLEVHAQLQTDSKIFCGCRVAYGKPPNTLTCPVCLGLPGTLPVLNKKAIKHAVRMILAVDGKVRKQSVFARKNYFYPDLPKGYQISQYDSPIGEGGKVRYCMGKGQETQCGLKRIHIEEDAGKMLHPEHGESHTRVDLNRCGIPLIEIVSEPDIHSPEEAHACLLKLKQILQYTGVCSGDMEKGHLRCDANISVRSKGQKTLGTRTEIKNVNSFKSVERALRYETERQVQILRDNGKVTQVTLLWNEKKQQAEVMRSKEEAMDYRYFPEPDLVSLVIPDELIEREKQLLPELPNEKAVRLIEQYGIREYDAMIISATKELADFYEELIRHFDDTQTAANWILSELLGYLKESHEDITTCRIKPKSMGEMLNMVKSGEISGRIAKTVFVEIAKTGKSPHQIVKEKNLSQISDSTELEVVIDNVLNNNPDNISRYLAGKTKLLAYFAGQVMKATNGRANPQVVDRMLRKKLNG
ncbi:MAG: Asp-tRNA(Asn)/Glu-tRNA(Gln) amidotransferase subunit GatB [candidate division Zixibacteria bacterium]|nr:Asp-tRNA(Asn)/Glu-tRNA(Gln) amidotransferase subunit GatB [candidate division Zixibacteria bacterium]